MAQVRTFDLKSVICTVGSVSISAYGEQGGIVFEYSSELYEDAVGADGEVTFSRLNDARMTVTITVKDTSKTAALLANLAKTQETLRLAAGGALQPLPFYMEDPLNGDIVSDPYAVFIQTGAPTKNRVSGDRTFVLRLPNGRSGENLGLLLLP